MNVIQLVHSLIADGDFCKDLLHSLRVLLEQRPNLGVRLHQLLVLLLALG